MQCIYDRSDSCCRISTERSGMGMWLQRNLSFRLLLVAVLLVGLGWRAEARSMQASRLANGKLSQYLPPSFCVCNAVDAFVCVRCSESRWGITVVRSSAHSALPSFAATLDFAGHSVCAVCKTVPCARSMPLRTSLAVGCSEYGRRQGTSVGELALLSAVCVLFPSHSQWQGLRSYGWPTLA